MKGTVVSALYSNTAVSDRNLHPSVGRLHFHRSPQQFPWLTGSDEVFRVQVLLSEFQRLLGSSSDLQRPTRQVFHLYTQLRSETPTKLTLLPWLVSCRYTLQKQTRFPKLLPSQQAPLLHWCATCLHQSSAAHSLHRAHFLCLCALQKGV